ncbi:putative transposase like protein [Trichonephila clavipes]|nr:putative transposase like protein [Trichonephila clavipes]
MSRNSDDASNLFREIVLQLASDESTFVESLQNKKLSLYVVVVEKKFHSDCVVQIVKNPTKIMICSIISGKGTGHLYVVKLGLSKLLAAQNNIPLLDWPGNSPDMNPNRKTFWELMKRKVAKDVITNKTKLLEKIMHVESSSSNAGDNKVLY